MKDKKGQALVEFVILIPILILIIFTVYDFGNLFYNKITMQNDLGLIKDLYINKENEEIDEYIKDKNLELDYLDNNKLITIEITKDIDVITPGLDNVIGNKIKEKITIMKGE